MGAAKSAAAIPMNFQCLDAILELSDAVRRIHSRLELAAIVFFLLLAFFDALAHWTKDKDKEHKFGAIGIVFFFIAVACEFAGYAYGQRNDALSESVIVSLDAKAQHADDVASDAETKSGIAKGSADTALSTASAAMEKANSVLDVANKAGDSARNALFVAGDAKTQVGTVKSNIAAVEAKYAPRHLSKTERQSLIFWLQSSPLKPSDPVKVDVTTDASDGATYAAEIRDAINDPSTGWKAIDGGLRVPDKSAFGVMIFIHNEETAPKWGLGLKQALEKSGIGGAHADVGNFTDGELVLVIARKN